jgi:hypothetical protein
MERRRTLLPELATKLKVIYDSKKLEGKQEEKPFSILKILFFL